jgi:hypothetical protein
VPLRSRTLRPACDVLLDQPEKRGKRWIVVLGLRIVDRDPSLFDAVGDFSAIVDTERLAHCLGDRRLALGGDRAGFFDDRCCLIPPRTCRRQPD